MQPKRKVVGDEVNFRPRIDRFIGVGAPDIGEKEKRYVLDVLNKKRLSYGEYTNRFEKEFVKHHKRKFAIFCNSGTSALQVGLHALKEKYVWKDGDEVIVPSVTFVASVNVALQNNLKPVFVDIEPVYYGINPGKIEEKITPKTRAIMPVHLFGQPCDMDPIIEIKDKYGLAMIEDSCETMFAKYKGRPVGSWGEVSCFSTYAAHLLVTGVGGLATTNDPELAVIMKSLFNHGRDAIYTSMDDNNKVRGDPNQFREVVTRRFNFIYPGYSYRATELEGAIGLAQIERWQKIIGGHQRNAHYLLNGLRLLGEFLQLPAIRPRTEHVFMIFPIVIKKPEKINRHDLVMFLEENMIETRFMMPLLNQPVYKKMWGDIEREYPVAKYINENGFYIGCHQGLTKEELDYVLDKFFEFFRRKRLI